MQKSYNIMAENGMDDMEYVNQFDLDPSLAYTPKINDAMIDVAYKGNVSAEQNELMSKGMDKNEAFRQASGIAGRLKEEGRKSLAQLKKQRGY